MVSLAAPISDPVPGLDQHRCPMMDSVNEADQSLAVKIKFDAVADFNRVFNDRVFNRRNQFMPAGDMPENICRTIF